jgi:hypothetical protein
MRNKLHQQATRIRGFWICETYKDILLLPSAQSGCGARKTTCLYERLLFPADSVLSRHSSQYFPR